MQIIVKQKQLLAALRAVSKTINRRPHLPVLAGIQLRFEGESLELTTTDLMAGIKINLEITGKSVGKVVVNGKTLLDTIGFFEEELTEIELAEKTIALKNGKDRVKIPIYSDDYPDFSPPKLKFQTTSLKFWQEITKKVAFASSNDQARPALTGVLLRQEEKNTKVVCTDGFRLVVWEPPQKQAIDLSKDLILSTKALLDVVALAEEVEAKEVEFGFDEVGEQVFFQTAGFLYFTKVINSNYPPFEKIIPLDFGTQITLDRQVLNRNLTKASVFSRVDSNTVNLQVSPTALELVAESTNGGSFKGEQGLFSFDGESMSISFNIRYLQDFLSTRETDVVWFGCNDKTTPAVLKDPDDKTIEYIVMPFKPRG